MTKKKMEGLLKRIEERQMKEEKAFWAGGSGSEEEEEEEEGYQFMVSTEEPCLSARPIHMPEYPE